MQERRKVLLLGSPVRHSVSPAFQQAAFDYYGLQVDYEAKDISPEQLPEMLRDMRSPHYLGANVTVPHKEAALKLVDAVDGDARSAGAVNTIVAQKSRLTGYNTDAEGFRRALTEEGHFDPYGEDAIVIGAGGAARAVLMALGKCEVRSILIANRNRSRAEALAAELAPRLGKVELAAVALTGDELFEPMRHSRLLVNATTVGMLHGGSEELSPVDITTLSREALVCDLVYNPLETPLLRTARRRGNQTLNGVAMLVYQGARAFELWTGQRAPVGLMMAKAAEALEKRAAGS